MKEIFKLTFITVADIKKFLVIITIVSILTLIEPFPFIGYTSLILEKIIFLNIGAFLIYIYKHSNNINEFQENLEKNSILTMLMHFFPTSAGIMLGSIVIIAFWSVLLIIILQFTNSLFLLSNPHDFTLALSNTTTIAKILIGLYFLYFLIFSYAFLGKIGESLSKESFKSAFISIILSLIDFKYWLKTFNLKYFIIYSVWSIFIFTIYSLMTFLYIFIIFPTIINSPNFSLISIPLLASVTTILTIFTFFSAYFAHKTTS